MKHYRVEMTAEFQADSEDEAIEYAEAVFGDVETARERVLTLTVDEAREVSTPEWVAKALER